MDDSVVTAVIMAGLPGEQSGPSIVDVLYGNVNPSGRLPYTIAKQSSDWPTRMFLFQLPNECNLDIIWLNYSHLDTLELSLSLNPTITYTEGLFTDYMYFDAHSIAPRFEFGFGLSYQFTATYSGLTITSAGTNAYTVTVSVKNAGTLAGTEISQLYLGYPASAGEPPKVLRGFEAVPLTAGQTSSVSFSLVAKDLRCVTESLGPLALAL